MLKEPEVTIKELPEFEEAEGDWIVCVLSQPNMKPKRAAALFLNRFDRFLEIPVDKSVHPDVSDAYYAEDTVLYKLTNKFQSCRVNPGSAYYKRIRAKRAVYDEIFRDLIEIYLVTDLFELLNYMEEVYLGIRDFDKAEYACLKDAAKMRGALYQPEVKLSDSEGSESPTSGRDVERSITREEYEKRKAKHSDS